MERERFCHPGGDGDDVGVGLCHVMLDSAEEPDYLSASTPIIGMGMYSMFSSFILHYSFPYFH